MRGAVLALALASGALASVAHAADALPLELDWDAPPGCASANEIRSELDRVARVRPGRTVESLTARGRIEKTGSSYRLSLHTDQNGVAGERTLVASDCRALEREVTLVLALAFGEGVELVSDKERAPSPGAAAQTTADATRAPEPTEKTAPKSPKASPEPPPSVSAQPDRTRSASQERLRAAVLAGGGILLGTLPSPAGFVTAGATFGRPRFWFEARALWIPRVEQSLAHGVSARYEGIGGTLSACAAISPAAAWSACLSLEGAALAGRSSGATESLQSIAPFSSVAPAVAWQWLSSGALSFRLEAALHVALNEPEFVVVGLGVAHGVPPLSPSLDAVVVLSPGR